MIKNLMITNDEITQLMWGDKMTDLHEENKILKEMDLTPTDVNSTNIPKTIIDETERNFYFKVMIN